MKIYEDIFSNQYTENELNTVMLESSDYQEHIFFWFLELLTLDNYQSALKNMPIDFQNALYEKAKKSWTQENIEEIGEIDIGEEALEGRKIGQRILDIKE